MKLPPDHEHLLNDVLSEAAPEGFRETLLGETLCLVRRRRLWRQTRRVSAALLVLGLIAALVEWNPPTPLVGRGCQLVHTQPLPAPQWVSTQPLSAELFVASSSPIAVVSTTSSSGGYRVIGDEELLALAPQPAVLIWHGPHDAELVFCKTTDAPATDPN